MQFDIAHEADNILEELHAKLENNNVDADNNNGKIKVVANGEAIIDGTKEKKPRGYDLISSFYCLHWIPNQRLALENIHKLLKPGGDALLVLLAKSPVFSLYDKLSGLATWKEYMQDVENFISPYHRSEDPLRDFLDLISDVGFETVKLECRERNYIFQSTSSLRNAIIAVNPFISRIPNHLHEQFITDCLKETEKMKLTELKNNGYKVTYKLLVAHLRRSPETMNATK
ncbi:UNVERIFIED_CONTAM: hypothetical protein PYX00_009656 [Menopon gallinae]|uniref:Juvenile hormone acid methyltransferase n=1 Tax=Menopon gallinae TaxID=328185 RepID=A0AAW2HBX8_9NEOP